MTIGTITKIDKQKNLRELARLTLLNILGERGVIYTHYKNKSRFRHNEKHLLALQESLIKNITCPNE
jgi:hypothetical protein